MLPFSSKIFKPVLYSITCLLGSTNITAQDLSPATTKVHKTTQFDLNDNPSLVDSLSQQMFPTNETSIPLPNLNDSPNEEVSTLGEILSLTNANLNQLLNSDGEKNVATTLTAVAQGEFDNLSAKELQKHAENQLTNKLQSAVNSELNKQTSDFLGKFGKASVNISIDKDGKLKNSEFHLLAPLYDQNESLFFGQAGVHHQGSGYDKRLIGNFGLGYRHELDDYLLGVNAFIDHDFTGKNTRLGLGGEFWADYAKLTANFYTPLSNWKESSVMKHYEQLIYDERPARGFDVRAQGYLPSHPQLGGSLVYEQYFGDDVALFSTKDRQKDPYALTVGLDYTPVPLLTGKVSHKVGQGNRSDTRFDLGLNIQLGTPLEQQLDPANVAMTRSLKGSRYDIVDRNYDIVFEYKQEDFYINLAVLPGKETIQMGSYPAPELLTYQVNSRSPIKQYTWIAEHLGGLEIPSSGERGMLSLNSPGIYKISLEVETERGYKARSNTIQIYVGMLSGTTTLTGQVTSAVALPDDNLLNPTEIMDYDPSNRLVYVFNVDKDDLNISSTDDLPLPRLLYKNAAQDTLCGNHENFCEVTPSSHISYQVIQKSERLNNLDQMVWEFHIIGSNQIAEQDIALFVDWHYDNNYYHAVSQDIARFQEDTSNGNGNPVGSFQAEIIDGIIGVDQEIKATITFPNGETLTKQQITEGQLSWVLYQPVPETDCDFDDLVERKNSACFVRVIYHDDDGKMIDDQPRVDNVYDDNDKLVYSIFRTQKNNRQADPITRGAADYPLHALPNRSEQGYWIRINYIDKVGDDHS